MLIGAGAQVSALRGWRHPGDH